MRSLLLVCWCATAAYAQGGATATQWERRLDHHALQLIDALEHVPYHNVTRWLPGDAHAPLRHDDGRAIRNAQGRPVTFQTPVLVVWLLSAGMIATWLLRGVAVRRLPAALRALWRERRDPGPPALSVTLAATLGADTLAASAVAIAVGGPGAAFWLVVAAFVGMSLRCAEVTLIAGERGGPPLQYLLRAPAGSMLAAVVAVLGIGGAVLGGGAHQVRLTLATLAPYSRVDWHPALAAAVVAAPIAWLVIGGPRRTMNAAAWLLRPACALYLMACAFVVLVAIDRLPAALGTILHDAFASDALYGGALGALIIGVKRGAVSHGAGLGVPALAHGMTGRSPRAEGERAMLAPFIDSVLVAGGTALVVVLSGTHLPDGTHAAAVRSANGVAMVTAALDPLPGAGVVVAVVTACLGLAAVLAWSSIGERCWRQLAGDRGAIAYRALFSVGVAAGAGLATPHLFRFGNLMLACLAFPHALGVCSQLRRVAWLRGDAAAPPAVAETPQTAVEV